jgi:menaquinone-dependent protoporphyrinogen oxidase
MTTRILVAYATKHGSTREVAEAVADTLRERGLDVDLEPANTIDSVDAYDGVVLGGSLYFGRWRGDAVRFLRRHRHVLEQRPTAVFALGPLTLKERDVRQAERQLAKALRKVPEVEPLSSAIFGGVVEPEKLRFPFSRMPASDARDWDAVRAWATGLAERLETPARALVPAGSAA